MENSDKYRIIREQMVKDTIENRGIKNSKVIEVMKKVQRHKFVPKHLLDRAYDDSPLPIGYNQTISQPYIVALMTELLDPKPEHKALEIGTGCGYQTAVLAEIVKHVYTIELVEELSISSQKRLKDLGYKNISLMIGDGYYGWKEFAPFDIIIAGCASSEIPDPLLEQLNYNGKMCIPIDKKHFSQELMLIKKDSQGRITSSSIIPVMFVPFRH